MSSSDRNEDDGILPVEELPEHEEIETISDQDRAEYEAAVEHILANDRDGDGDVDIKDAVLRKLEEAEGGLRRIGEQGGVAGKIANKAAEILDKVENSPHDQGKQGELS
jgi:hypothetical protein